MRSLAFLLLAAVLLVPADAHAADAAFQQWLQSLWPQAHELGVSRATFDAGVRGLEPNYSLPDLALPGRPEKQPQQPEFVQTPAQYLREPTFQRLAAQGKKFATQYRDTLKRIEKVFGVPGDVVLAIWARETDYGAERQPHDALQVLATQAYAGKRKEFFQNEFLHALKMLQDGVPKANLRSSWGGAMGLTQFLPSEYYKYAVDFDGDGSADIWHSVPDALASAAKQLKDKGWQAGKPWAIEVRVPPSVDCTIAEPSHVLPVAEWLKRGYVPAYGRKLAQDGARGGGVLAVAGGHLRPGFPDAEELLRDQGIQLLGSLRAVRRPSRRSDRRRPRLRASVEQERATANQRGGADAAAADRRSAFTRTSSTAKPACSRARRSAPIRRKTD